MKKHGFAGLGGSRNRPIFDVFSGLDSRCVFMVVFNDFYRFFVILGSPLGLIWRPKVTLGEGN